MAYFTPYTIVDFFSDSQRCWSLFFAFGGKAKKNQDLSETKTLSMMLRRNMVYLVITIK